MQTTTAKPVENRQVQPAVDRDVSSARPTQTRYGWCAYGEINLCGPDGTINLYVQPHEIEVDGVNVANPYHRVMPKGQLIPFPTFNAIEQMPSHDLKNSEGRAIMITSARTMTALDAAVSVLRRYSVWGFTILESLQGVDQDTAFRIFQVVQPLDYPMGELLNELTFGAQERIDATEPITFSNVPNYTVEPLQNDSERAIATKLAAEMEAGATIAYNLAEETLNDTATSMTTRFAGGQGKTGADQLDRRLMAELGRKLPTLANDNKQEGLTEIKSQMDFLVDREASRADKEKIAELEAQIKSMQIGGDTMKAETSTCGAMTANQTPCAAITKPGERCRHHEGK